MRPYWIRLVLIVSLCGGATGAEARALNKIQVTQGYIDGHFAVSPDGKRVAYLQVIDDRQVWCVLAPVSGRGRTVRVNVGSWTAMPDRFWFLQDGSGLVLAWPKQGKHGFLFVPARGGKARFLGTFDDLRTVRVGKSLQVVAYLKKTRRDGTLHVVSMMAYPGFKVERTKRFRTDMRGRMGNPPMEFLYFRDAYRFVLGKIRGHYDKKRDIRLPDKEALYDVLAGKVVRQQPIKDLVSWQKMRMFRAKHSALEPVVAVVMEGPSRFHLVRVEPDNTKHVLHLPKQEVLFDPATLTQQVLPNGDIVFGLTIDPQNPIALRHKRSDKPVFHLFLVRHDGRAKLLFTRDTGGWVAHWAFGGKTLALMFLHKNWELGDERLELVSLSGR